MGFLSGSATYECFRINSPQPRQFGPKQIEILEKYAINPKEKLSAEQARAGLLAGDHLFDLEFDLEKNVINDVMHFAMRIDTNQIPAAIRKAWLQMELAVFRAESPGRRPTKAERQEAKDAVEARCEEAARSGQYRKTATVPHPVGFPQCHPLLRRLQLQCQRSRQGAAGESLPTRVAAAHLHSAGDRVGR